MAFAAMAGGHDAPIADAVLAMVANRLCAPRSKRALPEWVSEDVVMPAGFREPAAHHYYRALDVVAEAKEATETHLYGALTDLTNLDLRMVCYDLTSTYFEGATKPSKGFESRAFGYSCDHRGDRPQVVIGLLVTGDGIPHRPPCLRRQHRGRVHPRWRPRRPPGALRHRGHHHGGRPGPDLGRQRQGVVRQGLRPPPGHEAAP